MDCGTGKGITSLFSMWMAHARRLANALCPAPRIGLLLSDAYVRSVPLATRGASVGKSCAPAPPFYKHIPINGLPALAIQATASTAQRCAARWQQSSPISGRPHGFPEAHAILRLDGQYGTVAVLSDLAGLTYVIRGKDYHLLKRAEVQARLHLPEDNQLTHPESGTVRALYHCPNLPLGTSGKAVSARCGDPSRRGRQESGRRHALGRRLRTVFDEPASERLHGC